MRVRPAVDFTVSVEIELDGVSYHLDALDAGVGGLALWLGDLVAAVSVGDILRAKLTFPIGGEFEGQLVVRHVQHRRGISGVQFLLPPAELERAARRTVGELLARGCAA